MSHREHHLEDDRLFDCYVAQRSGEPVDPPAAEHLADCEACGARYGELTAFMDTLRTEADRETDALFTADWLRNQQQQIARRLEQLGRAARVISFPSRTAAGGLVTTRPRGVTRWIAAAAAAGLFIGVGVGVFYDSDVRSLRSHGQVATIRPTHLAPAAGPKAVSMSSTAADEAFLSEIELAADRPHTRELAPFDALTPHVREVATSGR